MELQAGEPGIIGAQITTMYLVWCNSAWFCCTGLYTHLHLRILVNLRRSGPMMFPRFVEWYSRILEYYEHT